MHLPEPNTCNWLLLDLNAFFASVEQQLQPELRGQPVAVVPVMASTTCCIAASYEARAYGVCTGMEVRDARRLCPSLVLIPARQRVYIQYHHRVLAAVTRCLPVERVLSIDEMACRLLGSQRQHNKARELALKLKTTIRREVGEWLSCSIGLAPNLLLAKLASKMQRPDGLVCMDVSDLPQVFARLQLRDLPGIGERMALRLAQREILSLGKLYTLNRQELRAAWGSIVGERYWYWLHGYDLEEPLSAPESIGHQHVLPPALRTRDMAGAVACKLLCRAAMRLRRMKMWARALSVYLSFSPGREKRLWECHTRISETQDTFSLLEILLRMWPDCPDGKPAFVGVELYDLVGEAGHTDSLLPGEASRNQLTQTMDALHTRYGMDAVFPGSLYSVRSAAPRQIAFSSIPELSSPE